MIAISLWQPWASAVAVGLKTFETRSWNTDYRGPLAIHAAKHSEKTTREFFEELLLMPHSAQAFKAARLFSWTCLPLGAVVATCELVSVTPTDKVRGRLPAREEYFGDYSPGRFAWSLSNIQPLATPHFVTGRQGFFEVNL